MCCCSQKTLHGCGYGLICMSFLMFVAAVLTVITGLKVAEENVLVEISDQDENIDPEEVTRSF